MKLNNKFSEELFLTNETGSYLYHTYAENMPIIDYHCHLPVKDIVENKQYHDIGELWLSGDHYKWRAMRTFGIEEKYITGDASYYEKFMKYAEISPKLIGNPLYIWNALELKRYFGIDEPLGPDNAEAIYKKTTTMIADEKVTPAWCMEKMNVDTVCTTEDPLDTLEAYKVIAKEKKIKTKVLTAFRPDEAMFCEKPGFAAYIDKLSEATKANITTFDDVIDSLEERLKAFKAIGTTVSDDGIPDFTWCDYTKEELNQIVEKARAKESLTKEEIAKYHSAFMFEMAKAYNRNGFVMQLHIGTYQDTNTSKVEVIGHSTGFDCVDDSTAIKSVGKLLDKLTTINELPKTLLYPLNAAQIESFVILAAAFCDSDVKGKVQMGAPWWFNDQAYGLDRQFKAASNLYPVSLSVGMLTDSRSFLSYPRHEVYRRVFCNYLGELIEKGEYFSKEQYLKEIIEDVCYNNVKEYFKF
ncbi:MAG TPA: glucuronate isomerase [Candidatus Dorea intestinavium]|nr:glucuronate isomerase [Candidatus Dorea intestinavium]